MKDYMVMIESKLNKELMSIADKQTMTVDDLKVVEMITHALKNMHRLDEMPGQANYVSR